MSLPDLSEEALALYNRLVEGTKLVLSVEPSDKEPGRKIVVLSNGSPYRGDIHITVLSVEVVDTDEEARAWAIKEIQSESWKTRH